MERRHEKWGGGGRGGKDRQGRGWREGEGGDGEMGCLYGGMRQDTGFSAGGKGIIGAENNGGEREGLIIEKQRLSDSPNDG